MLLELQAHALSVLIPGSQHEFPLVSHEGFHRAAQSAFNRLESLHAKHHVGGLSVGELPIARRAPCWVMWLLVNPLFALSWPRSERSANGETLPPPFLCPANPMVTCVDAVKTCIVVPILTALTLPISSVCFVLVLLCSCGRYGLSQERASFAVLVTPATTVIVDTEGNCGRDQCEQPGTTLGFLKASVESAEASKCCGCGSCVRLTFQRGADPGDRPLCILCVDDAPALASALSNESTAAKQASFSAAEATGAAKSVILRV